MKSDRIATIVSIDTTKGIRLHQGKPVLEYPLITGDNIDIDAAFPRSWNLNEV